MRRFAMLCLLAIIAFVSASRAQAPASKPNPEIQKMNLMVGHWKIEGEHKSSPLGPVSSPESGWAQIEGAAAMRFRKSREVYPTRL